ncbi:MAG: glucose-6-phosphate dehydrogenase assembly protein OpcA [Solirubrobacteraceae bacterium]
MSEDVWSEQDTNPDAIEAALRDLLRTRHATNEALVPARVLNLVVVVDREWKGEVANRLERVGRYHASRTVLCAVQAGRHKLDAVATVSDGERPPGLLGVILEHVEIDLGLEHLRALRTIVDPILIGESPTVVWSPHGHDEAVQALLGVMDVVLVDSDDSDEPAEAFARAQALRAHAYVVDLAWLRTTPWRERLASSFDLADRRPQLGRVSELEVRHRERSTASALLLAGWLGSRLGWRAAARLAVAGDGLSGSVARVPGAGAGAGAGAAADAGAGADGGGPAGAVRMALRVCEQQAPGLGGVTVGCDGGVSLSLHRGTGGLDAQERGADGVKREWKILGASRGEDGILGEGVRQALLRDQTYAGALAAAQELCPA